MEAIENEGRRRGCRGVWLSTFSFEAPGFYMGIGYRSFGEPPDYLPGHSRHWLWKAL
jgi:hypothetical protein